MAGTLNFDPQLNGTISEQRKAGAKRVEKAAKPARKAKKKR